MIPIFVCEDDKVQRKRLETVIKNYIMMEELDMEIVLSTANPYEVLDYVEKNSEESGFYFLDIDLNCEMDGIVLATKVRQLDTFGKIVFVTTHGELAISIFKHKIEALDYIVKDGDPEEIQSKVIQCIQTVHERQLNANSSKQQFFTAKVNGKTHLIPFHEIMFFETSVVRNRVDLHLENRELQFRGTLKSIEDSSPLFIRVHSAVIVNKQNIKSIYRKGMELEMINGERCMLSVRGLKELKKVMKSEEYNMI